MNGVCASSLWYRTLIFSLQEQYTPQEYLLFIVVKLLEKLAPFRSFEALRFQNSWHGLACGSHPTSNLSNARPSR
ncbi:MAG: hypothetical protein RLZZ234_267 [Candidatus Parcubacteria bacterium]|jgi:hypothetical protein